MTLDRTHPKPHQADPARPGTGRDAMAARRYQAPALTEKRALAEVTLFSGACTPGDPNCHIGHP